MCNKLSHILKWKHHFIELLDKSIATLDILLTYVDTIHDSITWLTVNLTIEDEIDVGILKMIVVDEILNEMNHWSGCHILHQKDI